MAFNNPSDATEVLYGASGDVRNEINAYMAATTAGHYADETEIPGSLIIGSLRRSTRLINTYLEPVYADQIPFAGSGDVPKILDEISSDLATYYTLRSVSAKVAPISDNKKRDYYDAYIDPTNGILTLLKERELQIPELTAAYGDDAKAVQKKGRSPVFGFDKETNWETDSRLIDDIGKERDS